MTAKVIYHGDLRTEATHLRSGTVIETDAPVDNNGMGARFSPTDLVATALASCMCTLMGISARAHGMNIDSLNCTVEKIMVANPRRIGEVKIALNFPEGSTYSDKEKKLLERAALTCPVLESLHPDCLKTVSFNWSGTDNT